MIDGECIVTVNKIIGDDRIEIKMKKRLTESYGDFNERVMRELKNVFPYPKLVYKARDYHE